MIALDKQTEEAMVAANIARVLAEVKCLGILHFALFLPALQLPAKGMKLFSYQQPAMKSMQTFIKCVQDNKGFAATS